MKILITGSNGFIGKNLVANLKNKGYHELLLFDTDTDIGLLDSYCKDAEFVFHLAGVNRPQNPEEFMKGNFGFTSDLLNTLKRFNNTCPVMLASSIQAELSNPYGESKKAGENLFINYSIDTGANVFIYRFPNVFGKWCKPNYNSAVATFCHNIANDLPIQINDRKTIINLVYIDDVVNELINRLNSQKNIDGYFYEVRPVYQVTIGKIVDLLKSYKESRKDKSIPLLSDEFSKKLYSTYLSYLPKDQFSYELEMNIDQRGSFTEFVKTLDRGQVSINISKPGIIKGNHWHNTKNEKFLVVSGQGVIRFRQINSNEVIEYFVSGEKLVVVDIPVGFTHNIENLGSSDMVTIMWANEIFDNNHPDTYFMEV